jgi:hypothetical protein
MRMRGWLAAALVACLLLSGCSSSGAKGSDAALDPSRFQDLDAQVSQTTGGIKGVVVDAAIAPIPAAKVGLALPAGGNRTATADKEGRFLFAGLAPGTYFLTASAPLFHSAQTSVVVQAGIDPPITKVQLQPMFSQKPYHAAIKEKGFFECSQGNLYGAVYASSNCVFDPARRAGVSGGPTQPLDNVTNQNREWHADVGPGWQAMVFEMTWEPTAQGTSPRLGMVVSTDKATRDATHHFAAVQSANPMRFELDVNKTHETAASVEPVQVPPEGMTRMSYFVSAASASDATCDPIGLWCVPPGIAVNQDFQVFLTQFYYGVPPAGWSFVAGADYPF